MFPQLLFYFISTLLILNININAIGENPWDIQNFAEIISGIGQMIQNPAETVDVPSALIMGKCSILEPRLSGI
uniref:Uncharacterized protein n=1 Tax=Meloidogyne enterolobii TaxID=390850 RepID=A0A6V7TV46_MELEN|nr:unnamed protein product [Meloidogyne enterolobii]